MSAPPRHRRHLLRIGCVTHAHIHLFRNHHHHLICDLSAFRLARAVHDIHIGPLYSVHDLTLFYDSASSLPSSKMNRLFGSKQTGPKPTLNGAISNIDTRISSLDLKLKSINGELQTYQEKLSKMRDGPGKSALKQRALKILQKRKTYEAEKEKLESQVWNMEQAQNMQDNLKNVMTQVDAMQTTNKELRRQYGKVDIDKIERLQDEMADLMDVGNDIQESLSRGYDIPEEVDEEELDAELEMLGMEQEWETEAAGGIPGFLQDEVVPEFVDEVPKMEEDKVKEAAG